MCQKADLALAHDENFRMASTQRLTDYLASMYTFGAQNDLARRYTQKRRPKETEILWSKALKAGTLSSRARMLL